MWSSPGTHRNMKFNVYAKEILICRVDSKNTMGKQQSRDRQVPEIDNSKSKNVNAASVAGSTVVLQTNEACPNPLPTAAADVESNLDPEIG